MAPKRGNKAKAEPAEVVEESAEIVSDAAALKKKGKAAKAVEEKPAAEEVKNGKRGGDKAEAKAPAKRGRKPKETSAAKKAKTSDDENGSLDEDEEQKVSEEEAEAPPPAKRGGRKAATPKEASEPKKSTKEKKAAEAVPENDDSDAAEEAEETEAKTASKKGRPAKKAAAGKKKGAKAEDEPAEKKKTPMNKSSTEYDKIDFDCPRTSASGKKWNFKISSWNVDGIRAWVTKGGLDYIEYEKPDILCFQETKCSEKKLPQEVLSVPGYHVYWLNSEKEGYAGVGIYSKEKAISIKNGINDEELDSEGRIITAEFEKFYLICTYVPNAGRGLVTMDKKLKWNALFQDYAKKLDSKKQVIICGDMNVSHLEIDLTNPKTNKKNAGFTPEERQGMTDLLAQGFVDTFRHLYPDKTGAYTFWTYMMNCRAKNIGWRLDYAIVSERLMPSVCDNIIRSQVFGSDHCPITLFLHI